MQQKYQESWLETPAMRQTKLFMKSRSNLFTADLLNQNRQTVRMIVGILTGHCRLNNHICNCAKLKMTCADIASKKRNQQHTFCAIVMDWQSCDSVFLGRPIPNQSASRKGLWLGLGPSFKSPVWSVCCEVGPLGSDLLYESYIPIFRIPKNMFLTMCSTLPLHSEAERCKVHDKSAYGIEQSTERLPMPSIKKK
ncbi:hypothetical protein O3M35_005597 [Rhynocoris fuscipes]|uniref:Uncharacterized protein n=1 Tax=Rhynocoris fuscipes TaxID=488301 RepID=A0AAW1DIQ8_9HEMI